MSRELGISEQTYYRWRKEFGGIKVDSVPIQGGWQEIDVLGDLLRAREKWGQTI